MPRNVDPNLSICEEIVAIKTAALIAARLELLRDEGFMGAEAVLIKLQPCLRDLRHSIYTLDAMKSAMSNSIIRKNLAGKFGFRWEPSQDRKDKYIHDLKTYRVPRIVVTTYDRVLPGVGSPAEVTFLMRAENEISIALNLQKQKDEAVLIRSTSRRRIQGS
jgi:hypothetical protein